MGAKERGKEEALGGSAAAGRGGRERRTENECESVRGTERKRGGW
jgi:hypothetical protein